jgi:hypothetical protein
MHAPHVTLTPKAESQPFSLISSSTAVKSDILPQTNLQLGEGLLSRLKSTLEIGYREALQTGRLDLRPILSITEDFGPQFEAAYRLTTGPTCAVLEIRRCSDLLNHHIFLPAGRIFSVDGIDGTQLLIKEGVVQAGYPLEYRYFDESIYLRDANWKDSQKFTGFAFGRHAFFCSAELTRTALPRFNTIFGQEKNQLLKSVQLMAYLASRGATITLDEYTRHLAIYRTQHEELRHAADALYASRINRRDEFSIFEAQSITPLLSASASLWRDVEEVAKMPLVDQLFFSNVAMEACGKLGALVTHLEAARDSGHTHLIPYIALDWIARKEYFFKRGTTAVPNMESRWFLQKIEQIGFSEYEDFAEHVAHMALVNADDVIQLFKGLYFAEFLPDATRREHWGKLQQGRL